ncbi:MAG: D-TA family PLP-dependent enzyme [Planctomycetaceae bacterium]|nr:MAG: D-TA family PLP-dependent enzyme [Planctomycetaceae bacterium]
MENAAEVPSPALLIYPERVEENLRRMIAMSGGVAGLRPHVKTHKLPQIVAMKLGAGIEKFKASTIAEAEMTAAAGGRDILIAYQCVGPGAHRLARLIQTFPKTHFSALVDNGGTLAELSAAAVAAGVEMTLYLDLNVGMNRTGIEPGDEAVELYRELTRTGGIRVGGLHAYDGHLHNPDSAQLAADAAEVRDRVSEFIGRLRDEGLEIPRLIAGGTPTSPLWAAHGKQELRDRYGIELDVEVGAGTTTLWDFGQAAESTDQDYLNAAVLMARVISRPTRDRICLDLGHKAVAPEMPQPRVRWFTLEDAEALLQNEEHLVLRTERADEYPVGTVVYGIPRHICPTVALQSEVVCVRDARAVENWPVVARARRITI